MSLLSTSPRWAAAIASTAMVAALITAQAPAQAAPGTDSAARATVQPRVGSTPFNCSPVFFQSAVRSDDTTYQKLYTYSPVSNTFSGIGPNQASPGTQVLGYNTADNYVYELVKDVTSSAGDHRMHLLRIDSAGNYSTLNTWSVPNQFNVGDFWDSPAGSVLVAGGDYLDTWRLINVTNDDSSSVQPSTDFTITGSSSSPFKGKDITIQGNTGYGVHDDTLYVLDLNTRAVTAKTVTFSGGRGASEGFGSAYADALGNLYFFENSTSQVWQLRAENVGSATPTLYKVGSGPAYVTGGGSVKLQAPNDGASCPNAESPYSATITAESSAVTDDTATLTATVNPNSISTTAKICFGTSSTTSGGRLAGCTETAQAANASTGTPLTGSSPVNLSPIALSGLTPRTTYYWQVMTTSTWATTYGSVASFTTTAAPEVTTSPTAGVTVTGATLNGIVNAGGQSTTATFCYGTDPNLGTCTSVNAAQSPLPASSDDTAVSAALTGLNPGTTYYARVSATNSDGSDDGSIVSFTTSAVPLVSLGAAADVTSTDARLTATVNPKGLTTTVNFCWGITADLAGCTTTPAAQSPLLAVDDSVSTSADLTGLTAATRYYMRVTATNANGTTTSTIGSFTTAPAPLTLTTTTGALPGATVGSAYAKTLTAGGGQAPYTWAIASGTLPPGLTLNPTTGEISGTPTVDGSTSFVVRVTDATNASATRTFSIITGAPPTATTYAASSVAGTTATLSGIVDPGNLLTAVDFCYGTAPNLTGCTTIPASQSPLAASTVASPVSVNLTGLTMGTTYFAKVTATNSAGAASGEIITFTTTNVPTVTTGSATFLRNSGTEATLSGTVNPNGVSTAVSFCYGTTPTLSGCTAVSGGTLSASRSASAVSVDVTGLAPSTVYYFQVLATNSLGSAAGSTVTFTMPSPSAPGPTISGVSPTSGPTAGGTTVTITGTNFPATGATPTVLFGDSAATVTGRTSTSITVTSPSAAYPGAVDVIVANPDGQAARAVNAFTYTSNVRYSVTYAGNGSTSGAVPTDATAYPYDDTVTVASAGTMARSGYDFAGWNTSANGTGTNRPAGSTYRIVSDDTLYAQWTPVVIDSLSDDTVNFGQQQVSAGPTSPQVVSVINSGAAPMSITGITVAGADASDFVLDGGTCSGGATVTGNSSCTIEVAFAPSQVGSRSASLQVTTSAGALDGSLNGTGTSPSPTPGPTPMPDPTPTPPSAPRAVTGISGDGAVIVSWDAPERAGSSPITGYGVVAAPGGAGCRVEAPARQCIVTGLENGVAYTFRVRAANAAGWGDYSSPSEAVTPEAGPAPSILITGGRNQVNPKLVWVTGSASALIGETVLPQFRFPGQVGYRTGVRAVLVDAEGSFTWQRRTGKQITVRFAHDNVRSNAVRIPKQVG